MSVRSIIRAVNYDRHIDRYIAKERLIDHVLYKKLKAIRICNGCKKKSTKPLEIDHIKRVIDGGTSDAQNLQVLCKDCHRKKTEAENATQTL